MSANKRLSQIALGVLILGTATLTHGNSYSTAVDSAISGDYANAFSYWMPLAKAGNGPAQFNIALMYHGGIYVTANEKMALYWYRRAAENGVHEAQEYLAVGYREAWFGLPRNPAKAAYWESRLAQPVE